jgi:hypothetical protein
VVCAVEHADVRLVAWCLSLLRRDGALSDSSSSCVLGRDGNYSSFYVNKFVNFILKWLTGYRPNLTGRAAMTRKNMAHFCY